MYACLKQKGRRTRGSSSLDVCGLQTRRIIVTLVYISTAYVAPSENLNVTSGRVSAK